MHLNYPPFESITERFGDMLRASLRKTYGKLPSAAFVAREFNLRSRWGSPVSSETARRWLRGYSVPDVSRLSVFSEWLKLDYNHVFSNRADPERKINCAATGIQSSMAFPQSGGSTGRKIATDW